MIRHNDGDTSSETYSNYKRANESHLSESIETTTARRCTEGEASSEEDSRQDIQENKIEGSTCMFPTFTSMIPVMDNRSYTPGPLSTRGSVITALIRPVIGSGKGSFYTRSAAWISSATTTCIPIPRQRIASTPPTAATPLHEEPLQPLPRKMLQPNRSLARVSFAVDTLAFWPRPRGISTNSTA